jgi:MFS family permease
MLQISVQAFAVGPITRAVREDTLLICALAAGGASLFALALAPNVAVLAFFLAPTALASALFQTVVSAALSKSAAPGETGALLGLSFSVEAATRVVAPVLAGALISAAGPAAPGLFGACVVALALPIAAGGMKGQRARREAARRAPAAELLAGDVPPPAA